MTKEELRQEAEEKYSKVDREFIDCQDEGEVFNIGYILGAEPREKRIEELEKENSELKADNDARKFAMAMSEKVEKQLREENAKLKDEWQEQVQKATDEGYARTLQTIQLTKAKELLAKWVELFKPKLEGYPITPIQEQTEQFISEVEK